MSVFTFNRWLDSRALPKRSATALMAVVMSIFLAAAPRSLVAQEGERPLERQQDALLPDARFDEAERLADEALAGEEKPAEEVRAEEPAPTEAPRINVLELFYKGGYLMYPIVLMSVVVVLFGFERWLGLRRGKVIPRGLTEGLGKMASHKTAFDPRAAYRLCVQYSSPAANVIRAALLKTGRPLLEIEHAADEARDREADRLYENVRPIVLAVTITPLLGLLGTVWGMIEAFFITASNPVGVNRAESLAHGIYLALVTTFGGLAVAIPAAILAHYFEGRIQSLFHQVDELVQTVVPKLARFEGKVTANARFDSEKLATPATQTRKEPPPPPQVTEPAVTTE